MLKLKKSKILIITIIAVLILYCFSTVSFGASYTANVSTSSVTVGNTFTVTVNITGATGRFSVSGNSNVSVSTGSIWVEPGVPATITVSTKSVGSGTVTITPSAVWTNDAEPTNVTSSIGTKTATATIVAASTPPPATQTPTPTVAPTPAKTSTSTQAPTKSTNNYLESLSIEGMELSPEFNKNTTEYTVNVPRDTTLVTISASAEDSKSTVSGTGAIELKEDETTAEIKVVSESGSTRTYNLKVLKEAKELLPLGIKAISITGVTKDLEYKKINISPVFKADVLEYVCDLDNDIEKLIVETELNDEEDMTVDIEGAEAIVEGENIILINVKYKNQDISEDESETGTDPDNTEESETEAKIETVTYKITATKQVLPVEEEKTFFSEGIRIMKENSIAIIAATAIIAVLGVIFVFVEYYYGKRNPKETDEDESIDKAKEILDNDNVEEENEDIEDIENKKRSAKKKEKGSSLGRHF